MSDETDFAEEAQPPPDLIGELIEMLAQLKEEPSEEFATEIAKTIMTDGTLRAIAQLRRDSPTGYVPLHRELKLFKSAHPQSGFSFTEFGKRLDSIDRAESSLMDGGAPEDTATQLVRLSEAAKHFCDIDDIQGTFATIELEVDGATHLITCSVNSASYEHWLTMRYYDTTQRAPPREAFKSAMRTIAARTRKSAPAFRLYPRICQTIEDGDPVIYLDRGSAAWDVFRIDHNGVTLIADSPVKFIRPDSGIGELPLPQWGGCIDDLEPVLNLRSRRDFILGIGWVLSGFQPDDSLLQALLAGQPGSAKTTTLKRLCALIDPIRNEPFGPLASVDDLLILAQTSYVLPFDNIKRISETMSAAYCRLSTGGATGKRSLFTNKDVTALWARRPLIQSSTRIAVKEPDLAARTVQILSGPPFKSYRPDEEVQADFDAVYPQLFGAILTAVVEGLRHRKAGETVPEPGVPRMASFAVWTYRCEAGLGWERGTILNAYRESIRDFSADIVEMDPVASAIVTFMLNPTRIDAGWEGTATTLLGLLNAQDGARGPRSRDWPRDAHDLSAQLGEVAGALHENRLSVVWGRDHTNRRRSIAMTWLAKPDGKAKPEDAEADADPPSSWRPAQRAGQ
jgi:hypothetical protein